MKNILNINQDTSVRRQLFFGSIFYLLLLAKPVMAESKILNNPLGEDSTITSLLMSIVDILLVFAIPIILLFIVYAGFLFVTAQGDQSQITKARSALTWSVIGGVIVLGANLLIEVIENTVEAIK